MRGSMRRRKRSSALRGMGRGGRDGGLQKGRGNRRVGSRGEGRGRVQEGQRGEVCGGQGRDIGGTVGGGGLGEGIVGSIEAGGVGVGVWLAGGLGRHQTRAHSCSHSCSYTHAIIVRAPQVGLLPLRTPLSAASPSSTAFVPPLTKSTSAPPTATIPPQAGARLFTEADPSNPAKELTLVDLLIWKRLDWLLAEATESAGKGKGTKKVVPSTLDLLAKPLFKLLVVIVKGLIKGAYNKKQLLNKQFAENWNRRYSQASILEEGHGRQLLVAK